MGALTNGFRILDAVVAAGSDGLPFARIVETTGLPKASVHRLLQELVALSALSFDAGTRRYRGGLHLARLGAHLVADYDLRKTVHPHLESLHRDTGHVATLGVLGSDSGIYIDKIEGRDFGIRLHSEIGKPFPLHCTAMGKVLLAGADADTRRRLTSRRLEAYTDNTLVDGRRLRRELEVVAQRGYAIDNEEITRGLMCVAAPVLDPEGRTAGAMSCTFPRYVFEDRGIDREIAAVCRHARAASGLAASG
ncbi:MAG TPA: IclR family transcriptional regulator [Woeseiaceae bacterium]|nr:IclR family transcriptional regulator [Woeseiaceae bacterium]